MESTKSAAHLRRNVKFRPSFNNSYRCYIIIIGPLISPVSRLPGQEQASLFPTIGQVIGSEEIFCRKWSNPKGDRQKRRSPSPHFSRQPLPIPKCPQASFSYLPTLLPSYLPSFSLPPPPPKFPSASLWFPQLPQAPPRLFPLPPGGKWRTGA